MVLKKDSFLLFSGPFSTSMNPIMSLIPDLKLETDLEEESAEVDAAAVDKGEPKQCKGNI